MTILAVLAVLAFMGMALWYPLCRAAGRPVPTPPPQVRGEEGEAA